MQRLTVQLLIVSVPYWGSLYFNKKSDFTDKDLRNLFPSPTGVLYISMKERKCNEDYTYFVSVPYWGSLYFNYNYSLNLTKAQQGFRPLLGFFIFQWIYWKTICGWCNVSVPYWGSLYFNEQCKNISEGKLLFPSPTGVLYISIIPKDFEFKTKPLFPSPTGVLYISIIQQLY